MMLRLGLLVAAVVLVLDQAVKLAVVYAVMDPPQRIVIVPNVELVMVWNRGVSFGLLGSDSAVAPYLLMGLAAAISLILVLWLRRVEDRLMASALGLVIGGAVGNAIDRLHWGAVADFVSVSAPVIPLALFNPWPAFNVADAAISVGVAILLYDGFFRSGGRPGQN